MIVIIGLFFVIVAVGVAIAGVAGNSGGAHSLGGDFDLLGLHLSNLTSGQLFLFGVVVGAVGMFGVSLLLGSVLRLATARGSRRALRGSRRETTDLRLDHARLTQELDDERRAHAPAEVSPGADDPGQGAGQDAVPAVDAPPAAQRQPAPPVH